MIDTLLKTKLYVPPVRPNLVARPRLIERLNQALHLGHKLTLISAGAGFGKTTLASEWVAGCERPAAWLSLDEGDNDPTRFLTYLVAALQTLVLSGAEGNVAKIGEGVLAVLQSPQPPPIEELLTSLINEISAIPNGIILVLDDYHLIDSSPVDNVLTFLLEHLPPQMHLVIVTREDPPLPLARLRVRGQLTELRVTDLRFSPSEAAEFLNQVMGLDLSPEEVASLETRTEGWIAGLQLAALSMRGREDVPGFIRAFAGDNRFIVDYLVEEVLQRQSERIRSFLLQTSILDRLSAPLCDTVTGQDSGKEILEALERGNLFVLPLDDKRQWYRYHHLFADVLQAHAMEDQPDQGPALHRRASEWYEQNGSPSDAIRHALAAQDYERAADLVELALPTMDWSFQSAAWLGWTRALPDELVRTRPVLSVGYAFALLNEGELEDVEARLRDAERWLEPAAGINERAGAPPTEMVVVDEGQFRSLPGKIAIARAAQAQILGDIPGTVKYAQRALDLLPEGDLSEHGRAAAFLGVAYWVNGDLEAAHRTFADFMAKMHMAGNILVAISGTFVLADIRMAQGRLREAASTYQHSLQLAIAQGEPVLQGTADLYVGLSELQCECGDLEAARQHLLTSKELGEQAALPELQYRSCVAAARISAAQGDLDGALDLLDEAERAIWGPVTDMLPAAALKTRVWITQGRLAEALGWARERGLSVDDDLSYLHEFEHITLARMLIARYKRDRVDGSINKAIGLLARLLKAAEEGGRMGSVIEIHLLLAAAHQAKDDVPLALEPLERALTLAEPEGYVQVFVGEGSPMAQLLLEAATRAIMPDYSRKLLAAFAAREQRSRGESRLPASPFPQPLTEPLSQRELEVLRLLRTELSGPEIARELVIALSTVRTHTKSIYNKLNANNRRTAVKRAAELDLI